MEAKKTLIQKRGEEPRAMEEPMEEESKKMEQIQKDLAQAYQELRDKQPSTESAGPKEEPVEPGGEGGGTLKNVPVHFLGLKRENNVLVHFWLWGPE